MWLILFAVLALILIWALWKTEKPKRTLRDEIDKIMDDAQTEALNWGDPEAVAAFGRARRKIHKEFSDRGFT